MGAHRNEIHFIHLLRGVAPLPVMWVHLSGLTVWHYHADWTPLRYFERLLGTPLGLYQSGAHLGVVIFFLISGFIISYVVEEETRMSFAIKRVFRLWPPILFALIATAIGTYVGTVVPIPFSFADYARTFFLVDQFAGIGRHVLPVTWTLFPEVVFYIMVWCIAPMIRRKPLKSTLILTAASYAIMAGANINGTPAVQFSPLGYLPLFLIGRLFFLFREQRISGQMAMALGTAEVFLFYAVRVGIWWGIWRPQVLLDDSLFPILATYPLAIIVFWLCMQWTPKTVPQPFGFFGDISYSLYLLHMPVGFAVIYNLYPALNFSLAFAAAVVATLLVSWLSFRFVEEPSRRFCRRLIARRNVTRETALAGAQV